MSKTKFTHATFSDVINIAPLDEAAMSKARARQNELLKPVGSLGALEEISIQIAGITGKVKNSLTKKIHFLFGSDHGVYDEGVSASPQYFTKVLMSVYESSGGAINALCEKNNVALRVIDLGVKDSCEDVGTPLRLAPVS
ncbi:MAG: nicotinate-nucleotide--dimethylbenzimidazole phosphoribosyltransferase, partial [Synergistaceae bacterium]|nr:nicotinate-nucleotide--dimethylbenzimidazole phosphoribosyltransferase [Synergistaceae bacterium]